MSVPVWKPLTLPFLLAALLLTPAAAAYDVQGLAGGVAPGTSLDPYCANARPSVDPEYCVQMVIDLVWWVVGLVPVPGASP